MKKISTWALTKILPYLEDILTVLLPAKVKLLLNAEEKLSLNIAPDLQIGISWEGNTLSTEELRRWEPLLMAFVQELFFRIMKEKLILGFPGPEILEKELSRGEVRGILMEGLLPFQEEAYALDSHCFLLPEEKISLKEFLFPCWKKQINFTALSVRLSSYEDLLAAQKMLCLAKALGFTWLSAETGKYLKKEFSWSSLEDLDNLKPFINKDPNTPLILATGPEESLNSLAKECKECIWLRKDKILGLACSSQKELLQISQDLELTSGIYTQGALLPPLGAVWASFEHAKRLKEPSSIVFCPFTYHVAGDIYLDMGDLGAALKCYLAGKEGTSQPVDLLNSLAIIMIKLEEKEKALKYLKEAISLSPEDPLLHFNLGLFLKEYSPKEAEKAFKKAFDLNPQEESYALAYAQILASKNKWKEIKDILNFPVSSSKALFLKAKAYYELGELKKAFSFFKEVVKKEPYNPTALMHLAFLFLHLEGEEEVAKSLASQAQKIDPKIIESFADSWKELWETSL